MAAALEIILLERIENLGQMGDLVKVRNGYARNYLLPQKKALRATKDYLAYFESQRANLEKLNAEKRKEAEKLAKKVEGLKVVVVRHASEGGQLYGSVTSRDIAEAITVQGKQEVGRGQVYLNQGFKTIGLFPVTVALHPEVKVEVTVNIARSEEEAKIQEKTGKALIAEAPGGAAPESKAEDARAGMLEESALEAEKEATEEEAEKSAKKAEKTAKRKARKSTKAKDDSEEESEDSENSEAEEE